MGICFHKIEVCSQQIGNSIHEIDVWTNGDLIHQIEVCFIF